MVLTDKQIEDFVSRIETPKLVRRTKATVLALTTNRKLTVEGQRERVVKEVNELAAAERNAPQADERGLRAAGFYYRQLYDAVAHAEHWAKQQLIDLRQFDLFKKDSV